MTLLLFQTSPSFSSQIPYMDPIHYLPWTVILLYLFALCCCMQTLSSLTNLATVSDSNQWKFSSIVLASALTSNYSFFMSTLSSLSLSTPICQSSHLLRLSAHPILFPSICFRWKSNLNRYKAHCACLLFDFWLLMKYLRFLWSLQILNLPCVPSSKCLYSSRHLMIANISLSWIL